MKKSKTFKYNKSVITRDEHKENEYITNKTVSFFLLAFILTCVINEIVLKIDYAESLSLVNRKILMPLNCLLLAMVVLSWKYKFQAHWIKYMLISGVILMSSMSFFAFTTYTIYLIFIPIFISTRYFDKIMIMIVSIVTALLFFIACILNVVLDPISPTVRLLHESLAYNPWLNGIDSYVYITIPCLLMMVFVAIFAMNMTTSGRKLILSKIVSEKKIATVNAELDMAAKIQKSVLPQSFFKTIDGNFSVFAYETPAKEVCGDFYDYFMIGENILAVIVADVSDKGVPAAMFMMSAKKALQCSVLSCNNLSDAIALANKLICNDNEYGMFLTLWMAVIDTKSGVGKYVNAGHPYPIIRHGDGSVEFIENKPDLFIGNFPDKTPKINTFRMKKGDSLFVYTDGLTDSTNINGESFGVEKVVDLIKKTEKNAEKTGCDIVSEAKIFSNGNVQFDDITLFSLECNETLIPEKFSLCVETGIKGTAQITEKIQEVLKASNCPDEKRRNIGVAVDEICCNISEYAYEECGEIRLEAVIGNNYIELEFCDSGEPFNPLLQDEPSFTDKLQIGGFGIYFVKNLSDKMTYEYSDNNNKLKVLFIWNM